MLAALVALVALSQRVCLGLCLPNTLRCDNVWQVRPPTGCCGRASGHRCVGTVTVALVVLVEAGTSVSSVAVGRVYRDKGTRGQRSDIAERCWLSLTTCTGQRSSPREKQDALTFMTRFSHTLKLVTRRKTDYMQMVIKCKVLERARKEYYQYVNTPLLEPVCEISVFNVQGRSPSSWLLLITSLNSLICSIHIFKKWLLERVILKHFFWF